MWASPSGYAAGSNCLCLQNRGSSRPLRADPHHEPRQENHQGTVLVRARDDADARTPRRARDGQEISRSRRRRDHCEDARRIESDRRSGTAHARCGGPAAACPSRARGEAGRRNKLALAFVAGADRRQPAAALWRTGFRLAGIPFAAAVLAGECGGWNVQCAAHAARGSGRLGAVGFEAVHGAVFLFSLRNVHGDSRQLRRQSVRREGVRPPGQRFRACRGSDARHRRLRSGAGARRAGGQSRVFVSVELPHSRRVSPRVANRTDGTTL